MKPYHQDTLDFTAFKSKIETLGAKVQKLDILYNHSDSRVWTAIINPTNEALFVTGHVNRVLVNSAEPFKMGHKSFDILSSTQTMINVHVDDVFDNINDMLDEKEIIQPNEVEV